MSTDPSQYEYRLDTFPSKAYGRLPLSVNADKRLSGNDIRVYAGIAYFVRQGNVCRAVYSEIAKVSGVDRKVVWRSIKALTECGHVIPAPSNKERACGWLSLPSKVFGQKQESGVREVSIGPSGTPRLTSCPKRFA